MKIGFFDLRELVDPEIWLEYGDSAIWFLDPKIIEFLNFSRKRYNKPITVNNWHYEHVGKAFSERGFRTPQSATGATLSQHRFGRAMDYNVRDMTPNEVRADIMKHQDDFMQAGITTIEDGAFSPTWVHADRRYTRMNTILIVKP